MNKPLDFVLRYYREGTFDTQKALHRVEARLAARSASSEAMPATAETANNPRLQSEQPQRRQPALRRWVAVAASLLCLVALAVTLTVAYHPSPTTDHPSPTTHHPSPTTHHPSPAPSFHFDDTPLPEVLRQLERHYGVLLTASDTTLHLTADFAPDDLDHTIALIEEALSVEIRKKEQENVSVGSASR